VVETRPWLLAGICVGLLAACAPRTSQLPPAIASPAADAPVATAVSAGQALPPTGSEAGPSERVAAFYYPWYRTPPFDGSWTHWDHEGWGPPHVIAADYFPTLGPYSSADPAVIDQHFAWLRQARIGLVVTSWWGIGSYEDHRVPALLDAGERHGIKLAFHIEPYAGRTAESLVADVRYLYQRYGGHPAFFRTNDTSRWSPEPGSRGLFFLWSARFPDGDAAPVEPAYWRPALDRIHALPDGGIVLADENEAHWVDGGHFDGLYSYGVLDIDLERGYGWARALPPGAWYVPGINPGFSIDRIGLDPALNTPRRDGATYDQRWASALDQAVEPTLVGIVSFNEWHEGTQIEPAAVGAIDGFGLPYSDYEPLPPDGYLMRTAAWTDRFLTTAWPSSTPVRIRIETTSDWTTLHVRSGGRWLRPDLVSVSGTAAEAYLGEDHVGLNQPLARAEAGHSAAVVLDVLFSDRPSGRTMEFVIERGGIGQTVVQISRFRSGTPIVVRTVSWDGWTDDGRNATTFSIPATALFAP